MSCRLFLKLRHIGHILILLVKEMDWTRCSILYKYAYMTENINSLVWSASESSRRKTNLLWENFRVYIEPPPLFIIHKKKLKECADFLSISYADRFRPTSKYSKNFDYMIHIYINCDIHSISIITVFIVDYF